MVWEISHTTDHTTQRFFSFFSFVGKIRRSARDQQLHDKLLSSPLFILVPSHSYPTIVRAFLRKKMSGIALCLRRSYALKRLPISSGSAGSEATGGLIRSYSHSTHTCKEETFSSNLYPLAKEPPIISQTQARDVVDKLEETVRESFVLPPGFEDRSDAKGLSAWEIEQIRKQQQAMISTNLSSGVVPGDAVPAGVPSNVPLSELATPSTQLTQLSNGVRVVSQELSSSGMSSTVGVISNVGSRYEIHPQQRGATNILQLLSFGTPTPSYPQPINFLIDLGGAAHICDTAREQSIHCIDLLRPHVDEVFPLLQEVLLQPQWTDEYVEDAKITLGFQAQDAIPEAIMGEAFQVAAFGSDQQLGQPHMYLEDNPALTAQVVRDFWQSRFIENPKEIVVSGAGIEHEKLVSLTEQHFGHLEQKTDNSNSAAINPSHYYGGQVIMDREAPDHLVRVGLGFKIGGWHSKDLVTACVLQTLLGGGSSFSAGGPGKGMYSRLYRQVLNRYHWAESAEAFAAFYSEHGLFGLSGSTTANKTQDMIGVFAEHLKRLSKEPVQDEGT